MFAPTYFPDRYFAPRYFAEPPAAPAPGEGAGYFAGGLYAPAYFAPHYFAAPGVTVVPPGPGTITTDVGALLTGGLGLAPEMTIAVRALLTNGLGLGEDPDPTLSSCGTDLLATGAAWLVVQLQASASVPIVYQRGNRKIAVCATPGRKLYKLEDGDGGVRYEWTDRDFILPAASLVIGGVTVLPARGDVIKVVEAGQTRVYQVLAPGGEPEFNWCDPFRTMLRVHAKFVETQS